MNETNFALIEKIKAKEKEIITALQNQDIKKMDELIHNDLMFNIPNGQTITKQMDLESYKSGNMVVDEIEPSDQKIQLIGDNAIVTVILQMKGKFMGQSFDGKFKFLRVWKKINNEWQVIAGSSVSI